MKWSGWCEKRLNGWVEEVEEVEEEMWHHVRRIQYALRIFPNREQCEEAEAGFHPSYLCGPTAKTAPH